MLDTKKIKADFPILSRRVNGKQLVYLDNAATSQKPKQVINAITDYYQKHNANVHRGVHTLSDESTQIFEESKKIIANFFGASSEELILTRNATESINGVAYGWALENIKKNDVILTSMMEHHANIVPWQEIAKKTGAKLEFIAVNDRGELDLEDLKSKLKSHVKLIALTHVSNTLGTVNNIQKITKSIKENIPSPSGTPLKGGSLPRILIDGAQAVPHMRVDFSELDVDFYAFSGHKMLGPMGIGGLLVKKELLNSGELKPWFFGGGMIDTVQISGTKFHQDLSERFVAGTPDVASSAGLAAACRYLQSLGMKKVETHDIDLVNYALESLSKIKEIEIVGPEPHLSGFSSSSSEYPDVLSNSGERLGSVAFVYKNVHAHDVAQVLDSEGIAVRSGHHCCMPLHQSMGWQATVRASFQVYNSREDIDKFVLGIKKVKSVFM